MGRRYVSDGSQAAATDTTILNITSASTIRPKLYELIFGSAATPADQAFNMQINRHTAAGTSTAVTPQAIDPADPASLATAGENHTAEPTKTSGAVMQSFSVNQQATYRWIVPAEEGIIMPATAANGLSLVFILVSGGTALCEATMYHEE
jgi:hypothetical protein